MARFSCREALAELLGALEILGELQGDPEVDKALIHEAVADLIRAGARIQGQIKRDKDKPPWET